MVSATASDLVVYLEHCGGKDVVIMDNDFLAATLARKLRAENGPEVKVEARYNKVFLELKETK